MFTQQSIRHLAAALAAAASLCAAPAGVAQAPSPAPAAPSPTPQYQLEPAALLNARDGLPNAGAKLRNGGEFTVVFLGGSITVAGSSPTGYVTFVTNWLKEHYPKAKINIVNSGISGTGSDFGAVRYDRDVLAKNPDLVLIEFCVNDGPGIKPDSMERMVHKTWLKDPKIDIAIFYTLAKTHLEFYKEGKLPPSASVHERVAAFYGIPTVGTVLNAANQINAGEIPWEKFSNDGCHPNRDGYLFFDDVFAQALPQLFDAAPAKPHELGKSITPNLVVNKPPIVAKPLEFKGDFITAKGEKAAKVYPLPIPGKNWIGEPVFSTPEGKPIWRLAWMSKEQSGKFDPAFGSDKSRWEANPMEWFEGAACFTGPEGVSLFGPNRDASAFGIQRRQIGVIRFVAPETGRYALSVKSAPWSSFQGDDKTLAFNVLKFAWDGKPGQSLAYVKEIKKESKGLDIDLETQLLAGEELVFIPDTNHMFAAWNGLRILVGYMEK